jgi:hypothetical protein
MTMQKVRNVRTILQLAQEHSLIPKPCGHKWYFYGPVPCGLASPDPGLDDEAALRWLAEYGTVRITESEIERFITKHTAKAVN